MNTLTSAGVIALTLAAMASNTNVSAAELGMDAPPLKITDWIKGDPQDLAQGKGKQIYVVEFWATWCPPCRTSIPHLTEVQKQFKDKGVVIIGISDEPSAKVRSFVKSMGDKMDYVVAIDDAKQSSAAYMQAFQQNGIPHAFIVDKQGRVAWHGHPMAGLDQVLEQMVAGTYDLEATKKGIAAEARMIEYFEMSAAETLSPEAAKLGGTLVEDLQSNSQALNQLAWVVLTHPRIQHRDIPLALKASEQAVKITESKDPSILDTYARALFDSGRKDEAVRQQKKAIALCTQDSLREQLEKTLQDYESRL